MWGLYQSYTALWWLNNDTIFYRLFYVLSLYHVFVFGLSVPMHEEEDNWRQRSMHLLTPPGTMGFPGGTVVRNPPANAGDTRDAGSIPGSWWSPGGGSGNLLQYSCLENSRDKGVWRITMGPQRVRHNWAHTHTHTHTYTHWNYELPDFYLRMTMPFYCLKSMHSFWNAHKVVFITCFIKNCVTITP